MAQRSKEKYSDKQERKAEQIEEDYEKRGVSKKEDAEGRAWGTHRQHNFVPYETKLCHVH